MTKKKFIELWLKKDIRNAFNRSGLEILMFGKITNLLNPSTINKSLKKDGVGITDENFKVLELMGLVDFVEVLAGLREEGEQEAIKQFLIKLISKKGNNEL